MLSDPIFIAILAVVLGVALILALGIAQMGKGGKEGAKRSNKLMQARIVAQAVAVILLVGYAAFFGLGK